MNPDDGHGIHTGAMNRSGAGWFAAFLALLLSPLSGAPPIRFLPQWVPQSQFAGYYMALEKGFYREEGLDVEILTGGPASPPSEFLETNRAEFGTLWLSEAISRWQQGNRLVNLAQVVQRSAQVFVTRKTSGIDSVRALDHKTIQTFPSEFQYLPRAFVRKLGLTVTFIPQQQSMNLFLWGGVDACHVMWYNEYHKILNSGINPDELNTFFFADFGFDFPEDGIYCRESYFLENPDLCHRFVRASLRGWRYAFAHPVETLDIMMPLVAEAFTGSNRMHEKWMLEKMSELTRSRDPGRRMGRLGERDYRGLAEVLLQMGDIGAFPAYHEFYRGEKPVGQK